MIKFREKWSAALVFAILLHLAAFFIFYMNTSKNNMAHREKAVANYIVTTSMLNDYPSVEAQAHTNIFDNIESISNINNFREVYLGPTNKPTPTNHGNVPINPIENNDSYPLHSIKVKTINEHNLQEKYKKPNEARTIDINPSLNSNKNLENIKYDVVLLNTDIPIHDTKNQMNREYNLIKSEIEENNNQLSKAINEVKKRNQQKIEEIQARTNTNIYNKEYVEYSADNIVSHTQETVEIILVN